MISSNRVRGAAHSWDSHRFDHRLGNEDIANDISRQLTTNLLLTVAASHQARVAET
jgi:hypothetical protein